MNETFFFLCDLYGVSAFSLLTIIELSLKDLAYMWSGVDMQTYADMQTL